MTKFILNCTIKLSMKQKNLLSFNLFSIIFVSILFGSFFAINSVFAAHSPAVCETNSMKSGSFCNWTDGNSWCGGNTLTCQLEPDSAATPPSGVSGGTWNFCNNCSWLLTCNGGYTKCSGNNTCIATQSCFAGQTFDACSNSCIGTVATLKLAYDSAGGTYLTNSAIAALTIPSSGFVGIGLTEPKANLHVFSSDISAPAITGATPFGGFRIDNYAGGLTLDMGVREDINPVFSWIQSRGNSSYANNYNLILNPNGGNIGIGVVNPSKLLEVNGGAQFRNYAYGLTPVSTDIFALTTVEYVNGLTNIWKKSGSFIFPSTLTDNVGIGTANPAVTLDVSTDSGLIFRRAANPTQYTSFLNSAAGNFINFTSTGSKPTYIINNANLTDAGGTTMTLGAGGTVMGTSVNDVIGGNLILQSGVGTGAGASTISFQTGTTLGTGLNLQSLSTKMTILGSGNVGVGTAAPIEKLDLAGAGQGTTGGNIILGTYGNTVSRYIGMGSGTAGSFGANSGFSGLEFGGASKAPASGYIAFHTHASGVSSNERMRIDKNGNVGIGTTNPINAKLQIAGSSGGDLELLRLQNSGSTGMVGAQILFETYIHNGNSRITGRSVPGSSYGGYLQLETRNNAGTGWNSGLFVDNSGSVGIGTTAPGKQLEVGGTGQAKFNSFAYGTTPGNTDLFALTTVEYVNALSNTYAGVKLLSSGTGMVIKDNTVTRNGSGGWDAQAYSQDGYAGGAYTSFVVNSLAYSYMVGLNADPTVDASYCSIDYAWYITSSTNAYIYESCGNPASGITVAAGDVLAVVYDGTNVKYLQNGIVRRTVAASIAGPLYFDSSFVNGGASATVKNIQFGPMGGGSQWLNNGTSIYYNSGNVGIGTTTPLYKLDVAGDVNIATGKTLRIGGAIIAQALPVLNDYFFGGAGNLTMSGSENTASGFQSLYSNTSGSQNTATGYQSLYSNDTMWENTAYGFRSLYSNKGYENTAIGNSTLNANTSGVENTATGHKSMNFNTTGSDNTANGLVSLFFNTSGINNTSNGAYSLFYNTTGNNNTASGYYSGRYIADGSTANEISNNSIFLGYDTRALANGDNNEIVIGASATGAGSNTVTLGNDIIMITALKGNVGIGTIAPGKQLEVGGTGQANFNSFAYGTTPVSTDVKAFTTVEYVNGALSGATGPWKRTAPYIYPSTLTDNVGIGTIAPNTKLQISGGNTSVPSGAIFSIQKNEEGYGLFAGILSSGTTWLQSGTKNDITKYDLALNPNGGNVGIGTNSPTEKLALNGNMKILGTNYLSLGGYFTIQSPASAGASWRRGFIGSNLYWDETAGAWQSTGAGGGDLAGISFNNQGTVSIIAKSGYTQPRTFTTSEVDAMANMSFLTNGNVGIGTIAPGKQLEVGGTGQAKFNSFAYGTTPASTDIKAFTTVEYVNGQSGAYLPLAGGTMTGDINMNTHNISGVATLSVTKINATTIDPLYSLNGSNYATFVSSIAGGVKEECLGKINISKKAGNEYESVINFSTITEGSNLWVWRQVVDFNSENVEVTVTPYGKFAQTYYIIEGNKLIFRADKPVEISYRLTGNRFDWRDWPIKPLDQSEKGLKVY